MKLMLENKDFAFTSTDTVEEKVKEYRKKLRFSMEDVAKALGTSRQHIWQYENGVSKYSNEQLLKISQLFEIPYELFAEIRLVETLTGQGTKVKLLKKGKEQQMEDNTVYVPFHYWTGK